MKARRGAGLGWWDAWCLACREENGAVFQGVQHIDVEAGLGDQSAGLVCLSNQIGRRVHELHRSLGFDDMEREGAAQALEERGFGVLIKPPKKSPAWGRAVGVGAGA